MLQQAQKELEGVLTELEMDAAAVEPLTFVGQPQACLFNRSVPFAYWLKHVIAHTDLSPPAPQQVSGTSNPRMLPRLNIAALLTKEIPPRFHFLCENICSAD